RPASYRWMRSRQAAAYSSGDSFFVRSSIAAHANERPERSAIARLDLEVEASPSYSILELNVNKYSNTKPPGMIREDDRRGPSPGGARRLARPSGRSAGDLAAAPSRRRGGGRHGAGQ